MEAEEESVSLDKILNWILNCTTAMSLTNPLPLHLYLFPFWRGESFPITLKLHERSFLGATQTHPLEFKVYGKMMPHF